MPRCQDFPCCGHEPGCCPSFDESGRQLDMVCTCGKRLPVDNPVSICNTCLRAEDGWIDEEAYDEEEARDEDSFQQDTPLYEDYYGGE
jgi:hypothetical protein